MTERIMTLHPAGKKGVNIDKEMYEVIKDAILASVRQQGQIDFKALPATVEEHLSTPFDGSIGWYTTTVKLDLEARGLIERVPNQSPQALRLVQA